MFETPAEGRMQRLIAGSIAVVRRAGTLLAGLVFVTDDPDGDYLTLVSPEGGVHAVGRQYDEGLGETSRRAEAPRSWR